MCDRTTVLKNGVVCETSETEKIFNKPKHPYTEALIDAISEPDPKNLYKEKKIRWNVEE